MKHSLSILITVFVILAFLVSCGGSEGSGSGNSSGSDWNNSGESEYNGSSGSEDGYPGGSGGSSGHSDDENLKFEILDMNGNPITALEFQEGAERAGFQLYNGTGQSVSWYVNKGVNFCTSYDGMDVVDYIESVDPSSGVIEPGTSVSVVLSINPLVYSYKVSEPAYILISANGESHTLDLIFPKKGIPECSPANSALCKDSSSGLMWSEKGDRAYFNWNVWEFADDWCNSLVENGDGVYGYSDWRLPTIDELRTLIQNCSSTESGGSCPVSESRGMLSQEYAGQCTGCGTGGFSKTGDRDNLWSSSAVAGDSGYAWYVSFSTGAILIGPKEDDAGFLGNETQPMSVRCVRTAR